MADADGGLIVNKPNTCRLEKPSIEELMCGMRFRWDKAIAVWQLGKGDIFELVGDETTLPCTDTANPRPESGIGCCTVKLCIAIFQFLFGREYKELLRFVVIIIDVCRIGANFFYPLCSVLGTAFFCLLALPTRSLTTMFCFLCQFVAASLEEEMKVLIRSMVYSTFKRSEERRVGKEC